MIAQSFDLDIAMDAHSKELLQQCQQSLSQGFQTVLLVVQSRPFRGKRIRLSGKHSPLAEVVSETEKGIVVHASAIDVMAWIMALHGAKTVSS